MNEQAKEELKRQLREKLEARLDAMVEVAARFSDTPGAVTFRDMEKQMNALLDQAGDDMAESLARGVIEDRGLQSEVVESFKKNSGCTTGQGRQPSNCSTVEP